MRVKRDSITVAENQAARVYGLNTDEWEKLRNRVVIGFSPPVTSEEIERFEKISMLAFQLRDNQIEII